MTKRYYYAIIFLKLREMTRFLTQKIKHKQRRKYYEHTAIRRGHHICNRISGNIADNTFRKERECFKVYCLPCPGNCPMLHELRHEPENNCSSFNLCRHAYPCSFHWENKEINLLILKKILDKIIQLMYNILKGMTLPCKS